MKYLSLFSGIGGFEYGIEKAFQYLTKQPYSRLGLQHTRYCTNSSIQQLENYTCIGYSEVDKYARRIYERHYPRHPWLGDITKLNTKDIPDFDLLVGGFPCQAFSIAGKRGGFSDTRGTLFFEIARILADKRPGYFLLENVKGLLSHESGKTFQTILKVLSDVGYVLQWEVLNSKNFGVPQNRERVFIVGCLRGERRPEVFPLPKSSTGHLEYSGGVISAREQWLKDGKTNSRNFSQGQRIYSSKGISQTLAGNAGGQGGKTGLYETPKIRRLTPTECERLQGFPDGWTADVSDTQRYKCCGNAVTTNVITAIIERMFP